MLRDFEARCRSLGLAVTHQRTVIYEELLATKDHPTPEAVYERVKTRIPAISLGTVYKNIKTFLDAGLLKEVSLHHGTQRLDPNTAEHHHLICIYCRRIVDLPDEDIGPLQWNNEGTAGFRVERVSVELLGACPDCIGSN